MSTGIDELDAVLGELYWGDNVVWELDGAAADPFYAAIGALDDAFDTRAFVSIGGSMRMSSAPGVTEIQAGPGTRLAQPADLLREIQRLCHVPSRRLLLFDSLDEMVRAWGANGARGFFTRCCPFLLDAGAIAYWAMSVQETPSAVRDSVHAVTQCVLRVDDRSVRVAKAEGREHGVTGSVLHWHLEDGRPVLDEANITGRVAASLRSLRRSRGLSQHDLAGLAGVTGSAISQAERAERGLSLSTLARLSASLGITIDDLVRGEAPDLYRIGRRPEDPQHRAEAAMTLLGSAESELQIDLVQLAPREAGGPMYRRRGRGIVAVASGLVQVQVGGVTPAVRRGEVLIADSEQVEQWRNVGHGDALLFWISLANTGPAAPHRLGV
ncbi:MAG TPA: helix-turn-helix domain-containing protein [Solirubrobacteraceae bacterium]|nr:helix-turn-helix domain-containing protein [Solirubrobacteraceae bacterium]